MGDNITNMDDKAPSDSRNTDTKERKQMKMTNCSKRLTWSEEIKNDPHVKNLDPFGNYIICLICNEYGTGKGQKPLTMRRPFSDNNWKQHKTLAQNTNQLYKEWSLKQRTIHRRKDRKLRKFMQYCF